jgi:parvulin-like peptidyl-prolyl isomerase
MIHHPYLTWQRFIAGACLLAVLFSGLSCSKRKQAEAEPAAGTSTSALGKSIKEMSLNDVIVSVNGVELTKRQFEENVNRTLKRLTQRPNMKKNQIAMLGRRYINTYIPAYVNTQLLMQEARRTGVLSEADLAVAVAEWIKQEARSEKKPVDEFLKTVPGGAAALTNDAVQTVLAEAVIGTNVLPNVHVTEQVVQATIDAIKEENAAVDATNAVKVAWLKTLREQIVAGADFGKLADIHSQCKRSAPGNNGYWGEFERRDFIEPKMRDAVFRLKPGEVSDVLEDEEGFHLVKVLDAKNVPSNLAAKATQAESLSLAHILSRREPALEMSVPGDLKQQLFAQFKHQRTMEYLKRLQEKAVISYPNGTNFWDKANARATKPPGTGKKRGEQE